MGATLPSSSDFQRVFNEATASNPVALVASIGAQPEYWLENLKALQQAHFELVTMNTTLVATNNNLMEKINAFEGVDEELANAREQVKEGHDSLNQAFGAYTVYKDQIAELTEQLQLAQSSFVTHTSHTTRLSPKHPDSKKFSGDRDKLEAWIIQVNTKMTRNADHFVFAGQDTSQNEMFYVISRLEGDAVGHVQPYVAEDLSRVNLEG